jgi:iron complex outermembrane receptor protein
MLWIKRGGIIFVFLLLFGRPEGVGCAEPSSLDLGPIVITKSKVHLLNSYSQDPSAIDDFTFSSPIESLNLLPVDLESRSPKGAIQTDFSLRGSNFQGVLLLLNGQRINDPQTGHHNSDIPLTGEDVEKIEVIPGVGSSLFGPDAIGGAINITPKKPGEKKKVLIFKGGQYQTWSGLFSLSDKIQNLGFRLSAENQESDGFYKDTDFKKFTATLSSSLDIPDGEFQLDWGYQEKEFGAFDFYTPGSGYLSKEWTKTYLVNTGFNLERGGFIIKPNLLWRRHYDKFMLDKTLVRSRYLNHHRSDLYTPNIYFQKEIEALGRLGLGLEYGGERINSTNLGKHVRNHKSIFADQGKDLTDKLSLGASFRMDDFDGFGEVYTGSASARYKLNQENSVYFGVARSMRIPSFTELYYDDPTTLGNAGLSAEKSLNYQWGYDYKKETLQGGIALFLRNEKDFIDWVKRIPAQAKWQVENITEAEVFGIESYLKLSINKYLVLNSNYTYINKCIDDQGYLYKYGPSYLAHLVNAAFSFNLPFGVQSISFNYKKKPSRAGWFLMNISSSYNINKNCQFFVEVTNLLNVGYQEIVGIHQPGRWAEAGLRFQW